MFKLNERRLVESIQAKLPGLKLIYLFGSVASGQQNQNSDLDIAILSHKPLDNLIRWQVAQELACQFDIDVDLVDLTTASTVLCQQVITQGRLLWGNELDADLFAMKTISMYQHLQEERALILSDMLNNHMENHHE